MCTRGLFSEVSTGAARVPLCAGASADFTLSTALPQHRLHSRAPKVPIYLSITEQMVIESDDNFPWGERKVTIRVDGHTAQLEGMQLRVEFVPLPPSAWTADGSCVQEGDSNQLPFIFDWQLVKTRRRAWRTFVLFVHAAKKPLSCLTC